MADRPVPPAWTDADEQLLTDAFGEMNGELDTLSLPDVRFVKARGARRRRARFTVLAAAAVVAIGVPALAITQLGRSEGDPMLQSADTAAATTAVVTTAPETTVPAVTTAPSVVPSAPAATVPPTISVPVLLSQDELRELTGDPDLTVAPSSGGSAEPLCGIAALDPGAAALDEVVAAGDGSTGRLLAWTGDRHAVTERLADATMALNAGQPDPTTPCATGGTVVAVPTANNAFRLRDHDTARVVVLSAARYGVALTVLPGSVELDDDAIAELAARAEERIGAWDEHVAETTPCPGDQGLALDTTGLSDAAAATAREVWDAAVACDGDRLAEMATDDATTLSLGLVTPEEAFLGPESLERFTLLPRLLAQTPAVTDGVWDGAVWPAPPETDADWQQLVDAGILTQREMEQLKAFPDGYIGWRVTIGSDGVWYAYVAGD